MVERGTCVLGKVQLQTLHGSRFIALKSGEDMCMQDFDCGVRLEIGRVARLVGDLCVTTAQCVKSHLSRNLGVRSTGRER